MLFDILKCLASFFNIFEAHKKVWKAEMGETDGQTDQQTDAVLFDETGKGIIRKEL